MAKFLMQDCFISIDGNNLSDHAFRLSTPSERERVEVSGFNSTGNREYLAGNKEDSVEIGFLQDFAASEVHDVLVDIYQNQTTVAIIIRPTSAAVSAANPALTGNVQLLSYNGLDGEKGARAEIAATFIPADSAGLVWAST